MSSIPYKHEINNDVHNFIIQHDMGRNFSFLIKELYRYILEDISSWSREMELRFISNSWNVRNTWFKDVWNVTSELLFAAICGESGFGITFDPPAIDHDYDFIVNGYPVQVKSSNKSYGSFRAATNAKKKRKGDVDDNRIKYDLVINKVLDTVHDNTSSIDDALEQGAKIVESSKLR